MRNCNVILSIISFAIFGQVFAVSGGVIGLVSPNQTNDGRPLLWQNFNSDEPGVQIVFFKGQPFHFLGLVNGQDTSKVFSGLNTAGFGIVVNASAAGANDSSVIAIATFVKQALAAAGRIKDFDQLWRQAAFSKSLTASIACIDAFGGAALYETNSTRRLATDPVDCPDGFFVRADFNFSPPITADVGFWRYHRARDLLRRSARSKTTSVKTLIQKVSRDLQTIETDPYPLPFKGGIDKYAPGYIINENSINQFTTAACIVIHGVRAKENPAFSTFWTLLGEPVCGVAVPLWPVTGESPYECRGKNAPLNRIIQANKKAIYNKRGLPSLLDTNLLGNMDRGLTPQLLNTEKKIFNDTRKSLAAWRRQPDYLNSMIEFQAQTSLWAARSIRY